MLSRLQSLRSYTGPLLSTAIVLALAIGAWFVNAESGGDPTACCGGKAMSANESCCNDKEVYKPTEKVCCQGEGGTADSSTYQCCYMGGGKEKKYLKETEVCCNMEIVSKTDPDKECCGGKEVLKKSDQKKVCCANEVLTRNATEDCCGGETKYNPLWDICCGSSRVLRNEKVNEGKDVGTGCCKGESFLRSQKVCCDDNLIDRISDEVLEHQLDIGQKSIEKVLAISKALNSTMNSMPLAPVEVKVKEPKFNGRPVVKITKKHKCCQGEYIEKSQCEGSVKLDDLGFEGQINVPIMTGLVLSGSLGVTFNVAFSISSEQTCDEDKNCGSVDWKLAANAKLACRAYFDIVSAGVVGSLSTSGKLKACSPDWTIDMQDVKLGKVEAGVEVKIAGDLATWKYVWVITDGL